MKFILIGLLTLSFISIVPGDLKTRHTNLKCDFPDTSYVEVKICRLKVLGRGKIGASVQLQIFKMPVKEISINFSVFKKLSGYHPFLFNVTVDLCHFLKHPNRLHVFYYFYGAMMPFLNLNHSCPLNDDFILKDFVLSEEMFSRIPVPVGNYMFSIKIITEHIWRGTIFSYLDIYVDT